MAATSSATSKEVGNAGMATLINQILATKYAATASTSSNFGAMTEIMNLVMVVLSTVRLSVDTPALEAMLIILTFALRYAETAWTIITTSVMMVI